MSVFSPCPGATSDHAWRSIAVDYREASLHQSTLTLQGATWNMQKWCISKKDAENRANGQYEAHANNPMDISETPAEYFDRKRKQIEELKAIIQKGPDFIFLQEADWVTKTNGNPSLFSEYKKMLDTLGWDLVRTPDDNKHQLLVTLYDKRKLAPIQSQGCFPSAGGFLRGYESIFQDNRTGQNVSLVNLHLEYGKDYREKMLAFQCNHVEQDLFCIMGGDTNNVQNMSLSTMIGDWHAATNISQNDNGGLTTQHDLKQVVVPGQQPVQKMYDGFFVNPTKQTYAVITETGGMCFKDLGNGNVRYVPYVPNPQYSTHQSLPGVPWQRTRDLKQRLQGYLTSGTLEPSLISNVLAKLAWLDTMISVETPLQGKHVADYYQYAQTNRWHFFTVTHHQLTGDQAKAKILSDWLKEIKKCENIEQLGALENKILASQEYEVIKTGTGIVTRLLNLKTDSLKAFDKMLNDAKQSLSPQALPILGM